MVGSFLGRDLAGTLYVFIHLAYYQKLTTCLLSGTFKMPSIHVFSPHFSILNILKLIYKSQVSDGLASWLDVVGYIVLPTTYQTDKIRSCGFHILCMMLAGSKTVSYDKHSNIKPMWCSVPFYSLLSVHTHPGPRTQCSQPASQQSIYLYKLYPSALCYIL